MNVLCLIGDLVDSRTAGDRAALQRRLEGALAGVNRASAAHLLSPATVTLGDEYQAVYGDAGSLFADLWSVMRQVHPHRIRFSLGLGGLDTPVNRRQAIGMDGPAFHRARAAMEGPFKRSGRLFVVTGPGDGLEGGAPAWINAALALISSDIQGWQPTRHLVFERHLRGADAKEIAAEAGISPAAVYKNIRAGGLDAMRDLLAEIAAWMDGQLR